MTLSFFCLASSQAAVTCANAHRIDGVRLLHEHVLAGLDGRPQIHGVILRRTGDQHHVDALDHVLVAVQAGEAVGVVHLDLVGLLLLEHLAPALHAVGEDVGHGHQPHARIDVHGVDGRAGAAAAAADQADADHVAAGGMGAAAQATARPRSPRPPRRPSRSSEIAPGRLSVKSGLVRFISRGHGTGSLRGAMGRAFFGGSRTESGLPWHCQPPLAILLRYQKVCQWRRRSRDAAGHWFRIRCVAGHGPWFHVHRGCRFPARRPPVA